MSTTPTLDTAGAEHAIPDFAPGLARGPRWLRDARRSAAQIFNAAPFPRRGLHLWRYTDPAAFLAPHGSAADHPPVEDRDAIIGLEKQHVDSGALAALAVDYAGREISTYGADRLARRGVVIQPLSLAVDQHGDLVEQHLYRLVGPDLGKFEALNAALWNDGIFVYVPEGETIDRPIHLFREGGDRSSVYFPRLLVIVGRNAEITLIDEYAGGSEDVSGGVTHVNGAVEISAGDDSRVRYVSVQRHGAGVNMYLTHRAEIGRDARVLTVPLAIGGNITKQNFGVLLAGRGADSRLRGMLFGSGGQHFDNHTLHAHGAGNSTSTIDFKTVLRDRAVSAYTGLIRIEQHAKTCEAYQENRNLLLNRGPKAETIPELEILNEDVKCTHGATIGPIDPESVFYLASRGTPRDLAVRKIVSAFVEPTLRQIPDDLRGRLAEFIERRLEGL
ncbi:MAG: Fe-S cluster assembly protein SufD [candidate division Zixibacteria bacterium]|nr:Fe-S cluster assembly protein SufD [candidate division Zixibacteria bacterium]